MNIPLPIDFIENTARVFGTAFCDALCLQLDQGKGDRSIRINPHKFKARLNLPTVPWYEGGYMVEADNTFAYDPAFHSGLYYVQEAASMFCLLYTSQLDKSRA